MATLRFIRSHGMYRAGQIVEWWHEGSAREMVRTHKCEIVVAVKERRPVEKLRPAKR